METNRTRVETPAGSAERQGQRDEDRGATSSRPTETGRPAGDPSAAAERPARFSPFRQERDEAAFQRAEAFVDQMALNLSRVGKRFRLGTQWLIARAGEEAEDIWAEAQEIRRSNQQG